MNQFTVLPSECDCSNYTNVYECAVVSTNSLLVNGLFIWSGTAFDCDNQQNAIFFCFDVNEIQRKSCNNNVFGMTMGYENNTYNQDSMS